MNMQAVILSGGLGTRLRSLDATVPKPMVQVAGHPFLYHLVKMLQNRGISKMLFLLSYKSEVVIRFLKSIAVSEHVSVEWSTEPTPMGTGGALKHAEALCDRNFMLINGDSYLDMDYQKLALHQQDSRFRAVMTVYSNELATDVPNNVSTDGISCVLSYDKKGRGAKYSCVDAGVVAMERSVISMIPANVVCSVEEYLYVPLIRTKELGYFPVSERFYDIGTPDRLREFESMLTRIGKSL